MTDPLTNAQLELACRLGSVQAVIEALEEGADIDGNASSALFIGIMANDRAIVALLVERGADVSLFGIKASAESESTVDALMKLAPAADATRATGATSGEDPVDPRLIRAFDRHIRRQDLAEPLRRGRGRDDYAAFAEALRWIAAEDGHDAAKSFLGLVDGCREQHGAPSADRIVALHGAGVDELTRRYRESNPSPLDLLKDYLRERRRGTAGA